ncbi:Wzz/FepE/Etk N-terminal domain-containing protein [Pedobacter panaciterrae]
MSTRSNQLPKDEGLDISKLLPKIIRKWPLILLSVIVCLGLAYLYLRYTTPMFRISARVLVNDEKREVARLVPQPMLLVILAACLAPKAP